MTWLLYFFAAIGLACTCIFAALAICIGLQLTTDDNLQSPRRWLK